MKRFLDVLLSLLAIIFLSPLMLIICLIIICDDGLPVVFRQNRVGKGDELFKIKKFRTMKNGAPNLSTADFEQSDEFITRSGKFLRRTSLDELPQLFNVLRGEMSLVGPRPERPEFVAELARNIPFYDVRHRIAPGLTGWAQLNYRYGDTEADAREKLQYDLYYLKHQSLLFDLMICLLTVEVVLFGKGAR